MVTVTDLETLMTCKGMTKKLQKIEIQVQFSRVYYYKHYINQVLKAIVMDGVNVKGYYAWSLMDNFEWAMGYTEKFGLHRVNMSDPGRERTPKESAYFYSRLATENGFVEDQNTC